MPLQINARSLLGWTAVMVLAISVLLMAACGGEPPPPPTPTATPIPPTPTPSPADIVRQAGAVMSAIDSVQFDIQRSGGLAFIDADQTVAINQAIGQYQAPESIAASLDAEVAIAGLNITANTVAIGEEQWITNFLTQQWEKLPPGFGFNPAIIFSKEVGFQALLDENVVDVSPLERSTLNDQQVYIIDVTVEGDRVAAMTANAAASDEPVTVKLWIDVNTFYIYQVEFTTPSPSGENTEWLLTFQAFNEPVVIEPPQ